ncbi:MAG: type II toxin-antitoxin system prevent-host-death family antitoxin [Planctomycetota bacterium]|nr:type II toxin-antitoxin system prevent-host-death family antitoxin [Planctomycetota bacterium]MDA1213907.1 type II toxin-antitoxin system prevent-host-death family antitoxin [Planctomycetota bacterium]
MAASQTDVIGAFEAKTHFSELLERVSHGEEITITRHGTPIARLVPMQTVPTEASRRIVIQEMQKLANRNTLNGLLIKDLKNEGRK